MTLNKIIAIITVSIIVCIAVVIPTDEIFKKPEPKPTFNKTLYWYMKVQDRLIVDNVMINARVRNIPASLIFAIAQCESLFDPKAININSNGTTDKGVMQLNSRTFPYLTEREIMNVSCNIHNGCGLLEHLYNVYNGNLVKIIMAYNAGEGAVNSGHIPQKTINYLNEVLKNKAIYDMEIMKMEIKNQ